MLTSNTLESSDSRVNLLWDKELNLQTMHYGNGDHVDYTYDALDRVVREEHSDGKEYSYIYSSEGNLAKKVDEDTGDTVNYTYDSLGRLVNSYQTQEVNNTDRILQRTER